MGAGGQRLGWYVNRYFRVYVPAPLLGRGSLRAWRGGLVVPPTGLGAKGAGSTHATGGGGGLGPKKRSGSAFEP